MSRTVHLLGEVRCKKTHHRIGENTVPCLEPDACSFCADPLWRPRLEHFGPALVKNPRDLLWEPVVAVFTPGGWRKLNDAQPGPHRGRVLRVWRTSKGSATGGVLNVQERARVEPPLPAFDVEPHLLRLWFPDDQELPPAETPAAVPFTAEQVQHVDPRPEPTVLTDEQKAALRAKLDELREFTGRMKAEYQAEESKRDEPIELSHAEHAAISGVVKGRIRERFKVVPPEGPSVLGDVLGSIVPPGRNGQHRRAEGGGT